MSKATCDRFEYQLKIAAYEAITEQLSRQELITVDESAKIGKCILHMKDALIKPQKEQKTHDRNLTSM